MISVPLLEEIRETSMKRFLEMPVPREREEDWRYTEVGDIKMDAGDSEIEISDAPEGVIFTDLLTAMQKHTGMLKASMKINIIDKFSAFHYANLVNGIFVHVPEGKKAKLSSRITGSAHTVIVVDKDAELEYEEEYTGEGIITTGVEIIAGQNSKINFVSLQHANARSFSFKHARLEKDSKIDWTLVTNGSPFNRTRADIDLVGEGSGCETKCAFRGKDNEHVDFLVVPNHIAPGTYSNVLAKGILDDNSTSVFRGLIKISKNAAKTDSYLSTHSLILSENAKSNSVPSLIIDTNDVKAGHGATTGQIDEEQLFYLKARGLSEDQAKQLIVSGYLEEIANGRESIRRVLNE